VQLPVAERGLIRDLFSIKPPSFLYRHLYKYWAISFRHICPSIMEDLSHKAHRPAQSGAKAAKKSTASERHYGSSEKVCNIFIAFGSSFPSYNRLLLPNLGGVQTVKVVAMLKGIKPDSMFQ
jgi:hypothetical protein